MIKIAALGVIASILALKVKAIEPGYSLMIGLAAGLFLAFYACNQMKTVLSVFSTIQKYSGISGTYIRILSKMIGISFLCEFASDLCKDASQSTMAKQIEMIGKLSILIVSIPVLESLLAALEKLMGS